MMMRIYKTDRKILKAAKKAQIDIRKYFYIDPETLLFYHYDDYGVESMHNDLPAPSSRAKVNQSIFNEALKNLMKNGLIRHAPGGPCYQVTYPGWNFREELRAENISKLLTHVAFPSVVAFITSLVTILLSRLF